MAGFPDIVLVCVVLVGTQVTAELTCFPSSSSEMRVTFDSHRNKTGRWNYEIGLENQDLPRGANHDRNTVPWTFDVKYLPKKCGENIKDSLKVLISFSEIRYLATDYVFIPVLGYYKYYSTLVTWDVAEATCEQDGAHLAIINSQQEADALKKMIVSGDWAWIGVKNNGTKGSFTTVLGDPLSATGYNRWHSGHTPTIAAENSAAVLHKTEGTIAFNWTPTKTSYVFICEGN